MEEIQRPVVVALKEWRAGRAGKAERARRPVTPGVAHYQLDMPFTVS